MLLGNNQKRMEEVGEINKIKHANNNYRATPVHAAPHYTSVRGRPLLCTVFPFFFRRDCFHNQNLRHKANPKKHSIACSIREEDYFFLISAAKIWLLNVLFLKDLPWLSNVKKVSNITQRTVVNYFQQNP